MKTQLMDDHEYRRQWHFGSLLSRLPEERLDADELRRRLLIKLRSHPRVNREFNLRPRAVLSLAVEEAFGINGDAFCRRIKCVHLQYETARRLFVKLPDCHRGCQAPGLQAAETHHACAVCGKDHACAGSARTTAPEIPTRSFIERRLRQSAALSGSFRDELLRSPLDSYRRHAAAVCGGQLPHYLAPIAEIVAVEERDDEIQFVLPSDIPLPPDLRPSQAE